MSETAVVGIAYGVTYGLLLWYSIRLLLRLRRHG
ncbi:hypothetical protein BH18ACT5_BH18ACT5_00170 [soil metagenome]